MCGRASLTKSQKELERRFQAEFYQEDIERYNPIPSYNIAPTHMHPVITNDAAKHFQIFKWGLIPFWAKEEKIGSKMINCRMETVLEKPAFKEAIKRRRCLVPFDGFFEWKKVSTSKIPYRICRKDQAIFAVAGIWEKWKNQKGATIFSFSILTQPPNATMKDIHDRMPAILLPEQEQLWLDTNIKASEAIEMLQPFPDELLNAYTVSSKVNKVSENHPDLLKEVPFNDGIQGNLFF